MNIQFNGKIALVIALLFNLMTVSAKIEIKTLEPSFAPRQVYILEFN